MRHRALVATEALLIVGLLLELATRQVQASHLPNWGKVLFIMAMTVGLFGSLVLVLHSALGAAIGKGYEALDGLPIPLLHLAVVAALFWCYSQVYGLALW